MNQTISNQIQDRPQHIQLFGRVLCPDSFLALIVLCELRLEVEYHFYEPAAIPTEIFDITPYSIFPIVTVDKSVLVGIDALLGWLTDQQKTEQLQYQNFPPLLPDNPEDKAQVRHLCQLYFRKFHADVADPMYRQKIESVFIRQSPDSNVIGLSRRNLINSYLPYLEHISDQRAYLVGNDLSLADLCVAAYLSGIDYQGEVPWDKFPNLAVWYQRMKSRRSFSPVLQTRLIKCPPSKQFASLDDDE